MVCEIVNIFQDREWAIPEWQDTKRLRGCGFFQRGVAYYVGVDTFVSPSEWHYNLTIIGDGS